MPQAQSLTLYRTGFENGEPLSLVTPASGSEAAIFAFTQDSGVRNQRTSVLVTARPNSAKTGRVFSIQLLAPIVESQNGTQRIVGKFPIRIEGTRPDNMTDADVVKHVARAGALLQNSFVQEVMSSGYSFS